MDEWAGKMLKAFLIIILIMLLVVLASYVYCFVNGIPIKTKGSSGAGSGAALIPCVCALLICSRRRK